MIVYWLGVVAILALAFALSIAAGWAMRRAMGWKVNTLTLVMPPVGVAIGVLLTHLK